MLHRDAVWATTWRRSTRAGSTRSGEGAPVHAFKPFGTGERACIGRQFALHEATLLLGMIIHRYRLLDTFNYELKIKETLTLKPTGFRLEWPAAPSGSSPCRPPPPVRPRTRPVEPSRAPR